MITPQPVVKLTEEEQSERNNEELPGSGNYIPPTKEELTKEVVDEKIEALLNVGIPTFIGQGASELTLQSYIDLEKHAINMQNTKDLIEKALETTPEGEKNDKLKEKLVEVEKALSQIMLFTNGAVVATNKKAVLKNDGTGPFSRWLYSYHTHDPKNIYYVIIMTPMSIENTATITYQWKDINEKNLNLHVESAGIQVVMTEENHPIVKDLKRLVFTFNFHEGNRETFKGFSYQPRRFVLYGLHPHSALIAENDPKLIFTHNKQHVDDPEYAKFAGTYEMTVDGGDPAKLEIVISTSNVTKISIDYLDHTSQRKTATFDGLRILENGKTKISAKDSNGTNFYF